MIKKNIKNKHSKVYQDTNFYFSNKVKNKHSKVYQNTNFYFYKMNEIIKYMNNLLKKKEFIAPINTILLTKMVLDNKNPLHQMAYRHLIVLYHLKPFVEAALG